MSLKAPRPGGVAAGDFNGDRTLDLATASNPVTVLLQDPAT